MEEQNDLDVNIPPKTPFMKKTHPILSTVLIIFIIYIVIKIILGVDVNNKYEVEYEINGSARSVSITYVNDSGGTEQINDVTLPWSKYFTNCSGSKTLYIAAQNEGYSGELTVNIYKDHNLIKSAHSEGQFVIASTSARIDE
ncbi:MAG: MmpS family transport accessory protein [Ignavibacteriaceae bacterium]|nr:MmpS family transport accessory protein [Ignavibacteriaceae bacterium]